LAEGIQPVIEVGFDASAAYEERGAVDADCGGRHAGVSGQGLLTHILLTHVRGKVLSVGPEVRAEKGIRSI
jgi:hypothetical protein